LEARGVERKLSLHRRARKRGWFPVGSAPARKHRRAKKVIPAVMRRVGKELGNTPAVARSSYVSPAVIDQYLDGRTIEDFRPRFTHRARMQHRPRPGRTGPLESASLLENSAGAGRRLIHSALAKLTHETAANSRRKSVARVTRLVCDNCGKEVDEAKGAVMRINFTDARRGSKQADLCDACAGKMPGQAVARRGRRPKSAAA
jgi:hypothetical protein